MTIKAGEYSYTNYIDNIPVGNTTLTVKDGIFASFNGVHYLNCTYIKEDVNINGLTGSHGFYSQHLSDGYVFLSDEVTDFKIKVIPFPLEVGERLYGPFSSITTENFYLTVVKHHAQYTNKNGLTFNNVFQATDKTSKINIYLNEDNYIIQKEDLRYIPTVQSLTNN
ncbi:MAG: hypothetical protein ACON35_04740 [Candidatus Marinamargulisbacteria bacterium]